jgi:hypothetical protein
MAEDRTIHELTEEYGMAASALLNGYHAEIDAIRATRNPETGGYLDQLNDEQRMTLLREQKAEKAQAVRAQAIEAAAAEHEQYERDVSERRALLKNRLFSVGGADGAAALARTVTASTDDLSALLDVALQAGNEELGRAVFVAAERRGSGDLMSRYFDEQSPEGRDLYAEWLDAPTDEMLERQRESIPVMVHEPGHEWLTPPLRA